MSGELPARRAPYPPNDRPLVLFLALAIVLAFAVGTQYVASRYAFHPNLGVPAFVPGAETLRTLRATCIALAVASAVCAIMRPARGAAGPLLLATLCLSAACLGPLYWPYEIVRWQAANAGRAGAANIFRVAWVLLAVTAVTAVGASAIIVRTWARRRGVSPTDSHGTAHWGSGDALHNERGLLVGRQGRRLLRYTGEGHVLTVAPTRSGKGVSCVIPNLLDHPGSILVTDPKGENYAVTARWRREALSQAVYAFDPFAVVGGDAAFNPLDLVNTDSAEAIDDARMITDMLVLPPEGREGEQAFWNEEARGVLTGIVLHVAAIAPPEIRTLTYVRTLLTLAPEPFSALLAEMRESDEAGGLVARAAARILQKAEKERSGVISTAQSHTHFLDSPRMARVLGRTTADLGALKCDEASVYLVLPTERLDGYSRWLRLMIACALLAIQRARGQPRRRVLFMLDEFAHLGRMQPVVRDIGLAGGYGLSFWLVVQDLSQLRSTYGEAWPTFLANVDVLQAFGTNDWETAEYLSKMTGEATIHVASANESRGVSRGRHAQSQRGAALTTAEKGRRLLLPDEVRRLPRDAQLLFLKGAAPLLGRRVSYLDDREFEGRADPNPLYLPVDTAKAEAE